MSASHPQVAMSAVEAALAIDAKPEATDWRSEAGLDLLRRHLAGEEIDRRILANALGAFVEPLGYCLADPADLIEDWDDGEGWLSCDPNDLDAARSCAQRGAIDDALHHLERALPEDFGVIAERIAAHLRTRS